jgi:hypothetical protein
MPGLTDLPENEVANVASKEAALLGNLTSDRGFGSDVCTLLYLAVLSDSDFGQRTASGETVCAGVAILSEHHQDCLRHTRQTHGCLLRGDPAYVCNQCGVPVVSHSAGMPTL